MLSVAATYVFTMVLPYIKIGDVGCKIFIVDKHGITCAKRRLRVGRFKYLLRNNLMPTLIKRSELEKLLQTGTIPRINKSRY